MEFFLFYLESDAVNIPWSSCPLLRITPGRQSRHHYLEGHVSGPGILHHNVPEGHGEPTRPMTFPPQTEHAASGIVVKLGPGVHHSAVLYDQRVVVGKEELVTWSSSVSKGGERDTKIRRESNLSLVDLLRNARGGNWFRPKYYF